MGMINFYRRFISNFSDITFPLSQLLTRSQNNPKNFRWTDETQSAFEDIKYKLANVPYICHPDPTCNSLELTTDASNTAVGAVLHKISGQTRNPIGFFSKKLSDSQKKYSTYDRELLAIYLSVQHFRHQIESKVVTVRTDHKPLLNLLTKSGEKKSDRQLRHMAFISEYVTNIHYIRGQENTVADALSRSVSTIAMVIYDLEKIAEC